MKILIVNNNMKLGGVQKSLHNLLWSLPSDRQVTLLLFHPVGECMQELPPWVSVQGCTGLFRYFGISQAECRSRKEKLCRGLLALGCKFLGRPRIAKWLCRREGLRPEHYDCAISFLQNGRKKQLYGGTVDYVLGCVNADRKIAFLHCDYGKCGANHGENNEAMCRFDRIAACSEGCRDAFLQVLPQLADRCYTVKNCHRFQTLRRLAQEDPVPYPSEGIHLLMVCRLAHEKGIERAVEALAQLCRDGQTAFLHIVGDGPMKGQLTELTERLGMQERVRFYGAQSNPYRFMTNAHLLLISSYHEAAPMVIEEAACIGLPCLTVETTSAREMVEEGGCGWVCQNSTEALQLALAELLKDPERLQEKKKELSELSPHNGKALEQFDILIEG